MSKYLWNSKMQFRLITIDVWSKIFVTAYHLVMILRPKNTVQPILSPHILMSNPPFNTLQGSQSNNNVCQCQHQCHSYYHCLCLCPSLWFFYIFIKLYCNSLGSLWCCVLFNMLVELWLGQHKCSGQANHTYSLKSDRKICPMYSSTCRTVLDT